MQLAPWLAERAEQLARRKAIYEALHPETKKGVVQAIKMNRKLGHDVAVQYDKYVSDNLSLTYPSYTFSEDTANKTGISKRSIERDVQIATRIPEDVRELLRSTPVAERSPRPTPHAKRTPFRQGLRQRARNGAHGAITARDRLPQGTPGKRLSEAMARLGEGCGGGRRLTRG